MAHWPREPAGTMCSSTPNTVLYRQFLHFSGHQCLVFEMEIIVIVSVQGDWEATSGT